MDRISHSSVQLDFFQSEPKSFHNTIDLEPEAFYRADANAKRQEDKVLELFKDGKQRNAWEAYKELSARGETMIKDSVKRAITNLTTEKFGCKLIKTSDKTQGEYQMLNYQYRIK